LKLKQSSSALSPRVYQNTHQPRCNISFVYIKHSKWLFLHFVCTKYSKWLHFGTGLCLCWLNGCRRRRTFFHFQNVMSVISQFKIIKSYLILIWFDTDGKDGHSTTPHIQRVKLGICLRSNEPCAVIGWTDAPKCEYCPKCWYEMDKMESEQPTWGPMLRSERWGLAKMSLYTKWGRCWGGCAFTLSFQIKIGYTDTQAYNEINRWLAGCNIISHNTKLNVNLLGQ
jgi:hypothetical protein